MRRYARAALLGLLLVAALGAGLLLNLEDFLHRSDAPAPADAIVVLGGEGTPCERTRQALRLAAQGYAHTIVLSSPAANDAECATLIARGAQAAGVQRVHGLERARSTYDEAARVQQLANQEQWRALIVVTDIFHTRRAGQTFRALLPSAQIYVDGIVPARRQTLRWWQDKDLRTEVLTEVMKLAYYWLFYGIAPL